MSASAELQKAIYDALVADAGVTALVSGRIHDMPPPGVRFPFVSFGPSDTVDEDADCIDARMEVVQLDIWSRAKDGRVEAKRIVDAVKTALHRTAPVMAVNALVGLRVVLTRILDDPDGITVHGVVQVEAHVEERAA